MKLPKSFIPNKNLEKKTLQLIEGPKLKELDPGISISTKDIDSEGFYKTNILGGATLSTEIMKKINEAVNDSPKEFNIYYFDIG